VTYKIFFEEKAKKELSRVDKPFQKLIAEKIKQLSENFDLMANNMIPLKGKYDYYRLRVGKYRVIFHKDDEQIIITIVRVGHRKNIYEKL